MLWLKHRVLTSLAPNAPRGLIESIALLDTFVPWQSTVIVNHQWCCCCCAESDQPSRDHTCLSSFGSFPLIAAALGKLTATVPLGKR